MSVEWVIVAVYVDGGVFLLRNRLEILHWFIDLEKIVEFLFFVETIQRYKCRISFQWKLKMFLNQL